MKTPASILLATLALFTASCAPTAPRGPLPPGVVSHGSLTNRKLMADASIGAVAALAVKGYRVDPHRTSMTAYVVSMPQGSPGSRQWTERWVYDVSGRQVPITIYFRESGMGAADYTIRP
ncbi:hypothetical protein KBB96_08550 [Luteolibacter ambystomatis]|uniref:DUF2845 domain-containing protein n=1 Tax=Luteolibacter ambystomatis TaxID=2824561 RepID=A0A975PGP2_9BACT|nr:hypothetical protein [Luteolibacter ambystomatis]QUE52928.1 hypothetical protein KBB96_08550 [Luteolibacter ambystomatis]